MRLLPLVTRNLRQASAQAGAPAIWGDPTSGGWNKLCVALSETGGSFAGGRSLSRQEEGRQHRSGRRLRVEPGACDKPLVATGAEVLASSYSRCEQMRASRAVGGGHGGSSQPSEKSANCRP